MHIFLSFHYLYYSSLVWTYLFEANLAHNFQSGLRFVLSFRCYISLLFFLSVLDTFIVSFWLNFCFLTPDFLFLLLQLLFPSVFLHCTFLIFYKEGLP